MYFSAACSIPDPSSAMVVVTGGHENYKEVSRYGRGAVQPVLHCTVLYCTAGMGWRAGLQTCHGSMWGDITMGVAAMCPVETW